MQRKGLSEYLKAIRQPTQAVNKHNDIIIYTARSLTLQQIISSAADFLPGG